MDPSGKMTRPVPQEVHFPFPPLAGIRSLGTEMGVPQDMQRNMRLGKALPP